MDFRSFDFNNKTQMKKSILSYMCFTIAAMIMGSSYLFAQITNSKESFTDHQKLALDIFRELIEINTTVNNGCTKAANAMAERLSNAGFPHEDINLLGPNSQHMNLVARYHGKGNLPPILFIGHLDVVEAMSKDWSVDPFKFQEIDGYFYGRGTSDMKCEDADIIANFIRLKHEGFVPNRDIIVALTEDEEGGDYNGVEWLLKNHRDLIEAEYCINMEGGGGDIKNGQHTMMEVQTSEKTYLDLTLEVKNKGGHSSIPVKENAIYRLANALTRISNFNFPIRLNETTKMFFERSALQETGTIKSDMINAPRDSAAANRLAMYAPYYNSMLRTTCVATMVSGGHAQNALPQFASANINCRILPDESQDYVIETLKSVISDTMVSIKFKYPAISGPLSIMRKDVWDPVEKLTATMWPGVMVTPVMSTGASDGKFIRNAGMSVYGVSGIFFEIDDIRAHGRDERIGIKEFYEGVDFMYSLIKALTME